MKFIHRLAYYLVGFSIGLVFLAFFLQGKEASCDYSPGARVKKNIRIKPKTLSAEVQQLLDQKHIDTSYITHLLHQGKVNFSESDTKKDSCNIYVITGKQDEKKIKMKVENCPKEAVILEFLIND